LRVRYGSVPAAPIVVLFARIPRPHHLNAVNEKERSEFSIGELAREFDVTPRAIRFYEDQGLLAPKRSGQRRIYAARDRTRLKLTLRGKRLGLTLSEIRELLDMYEPGRDERPQLERFLAVLENHKTSLEQQRAQLRQRFGADADFQFRVAVENGQVRLKAKRIG